MIASHLTHPQTLRASESPPLTSAQRDLSASLLASTCRGGYLPSTYLALSIEDNPGLIPERIGGPTAGLLEALDIKVVELGY